MLLCQCWNRSAILHRTAFYFLPHLSAKMKTRILSNLLPFIITRKTEKNKSFKMKGSQEECEEINLKPLFHGECSEKDHFPYTLSAFFLYKY